MKSESSITHPVQGLGNINDVTTFLSDATVKDFFSYSEKTIRHLWLLFNCTKPTSNPSNFTELFPDEAITQYRDRHGNAIHGGRRLNYWCRQHKNTNPSSVLERQKAYLANKALPACRRKMADLLFSRRLACGERDEYLSTCPDSLKQFLTSIMSELSDEFKIDVMRAEACMQRIAAS